MLVGGLLSSGTPGGAKPPLACLGPLPVDPDKAGAVGVVGGTALERLGVWD